MVNQPFMDVYILKNAWGHTQENLAKHPIYSSCDTSKPLRRSPQHITTENLKISMNVLLLVWPLLLQWQHALILPWTPHQNLKISVVSLHFDNIPKRSLNLTQTTISMFTQCGIPEGIQTHSTMQEILSVHTIVHVSWSKRFKGMKVTFIPTLWW